MAAGHDETMDDPVDVGLVVGEYPFVHTITEAWAMVAHRLIALAHILAHPYITRSDFLPRKWERLFGDRQARPR